MGETSRCRLALAALGLAALAAGATAAPPGAASASAPTYDITTLAGKVASVNGTAGLNVRFSGDVEEAAEPPEAAGSSSGPITPANVPSSPLDGTSVQAPDVTVNQDAHAAPQRETAIAVDPGDPRIVVGGANDMVTGTWSCSVSGTPCSALGTGNTSGYLSTDGGATWCCASSDPQHLGTLIPGVTHLAGGPYEWGSDPSVAFDSRGAVYFASIGYYRIQPPNAVAVTRGAVSGGTLAWSAPTFVNATTSPAIFNDKDWIGADSHPTSPFRDRVYVSWTRFVFNPQNGAYVQSPIDFAWSSDGGRTFSAPQPIVANVLYDQGSRIVVGPDGTVYVFFEGAPRVAMLDSIYMVKSTDGGTTWSRPVAVAPLQNIVPVADARFRDNSFPAADIAPDGTLYAAWSSLVADGGGLCPARTNSGCHASAVYSRSSDGGSTWTSPAPIDAALDSSVRTPIGYPQAQPDGSGNLVAPSPRRVDTFFPSVAVSPSGNVYMSAYAAGVVSPWRCAPNSGAPLSRGPTARSSATTSTTPASTTSSGT